jgi:hypothetical protein
MCRQTVIKLCFLTLQQKASEQPGASTTSQPSTLVDLFVSVEKIMVLNTDLQVKFNHVG